MGESDNPASRSGQTQLQLGQLDIWVSLTSLRWRGPATEGAGLKEVRRVAGLRLLRRPQLFPKEYHPICICNTDLVKTRHSNARLEAFLKILTWLFFIKSGFYLWNVPKSRACLSSAALVQTHHQGQMWAWETCAPATCPAGASLGWLCVCGLPPRRGPATKPCLGRVIHTQHRTRRLRTMAVHLSAPRWRTGREGHAKHRLYFWGLVTGGPMGGRAGREGGSGLSLWTRAGPGRKWLEAQAPGWNTDRVRERPSSLSPAHFWPLPV